MASLIAPSTPCTFQSRRTNSSLQRNSSMFGSLKHKLSRKDKTSSIPRSLSIKSTPNDHPQISSTPSTRRPANPPGMNNPFRDMGEAPPPYSPNPSATSPVQSPSLRVTPASPVYSSSSSRASGSRPATPVTSQSQGADDPYSFLSSFDTVFLIDDSGSMAGSRWRETREALEKITPICTAHDADGIDIYFLNSAELPDHHNVKDEDRVRKIFKKVNPGGGTPTGQSLNRIIKPYVRRYEARPESTKPLNVICITDGEPSDDVESPLIWAAKKLDKLDAPAWQLGVQFFQVGRDEEAKRHLKQLDDDLAEIAGDDELRDIVDTVPFNGPEGTTLSVDGILKVVLGAVNRRLDRKKSKDLHR